MSGGLIQTRLSALNEHRKRMVLGNIEHHIKHTNFLNGAYIIRLFIECFRLKNPDAGACSPIWKGACWDASFKVNSIEAATNIVDIVFNEFWEDDYDGYIILFLNRYFLNFYDEDSNLFLEEFKLTNGEFL